jgi:hypothetical protein
LRIIGRPPLPSSTPYTLSGTKIEPDRAWEQ